MLAGLVLDFSAEFSTELGVNITHLRSAFSRAESKLSRACEQDGNRWQTIATAALISRWLEKELRASAAFAIIAPSIAQKTKDPAVPDPSQVLLYRRLSYTLQAAPKRLRRLRLRGVRLTPSRG